MGSKQITAYIGCVDYQHLVCARLEIGFSKNTVISH